MDYLSEIKSIEPHKEHVLMNYKEVVLDMLRFQFPLLSRQEIEMAVEWSIGKRMKDHPVKIDNNYKKQTVDSTILQLTEYIMERNPIITSYGVMFKRHGEIPNPIYSLVDGFIQARDKDKKEMFKYPKGSELFERYNLLQLLDKIDVNGYYGTTGMYSCIYYNLYTACTTTTQAKSCISAIALFFESFLSCNVPYGSLNELITYIHNILKEQRYYKDEDWLDENITYSECFYHLMDCTGWGWIPSEEDMEIIWNIITALPQEDINRLFYKNNLYHFIDNSKIKALIVQFLQKLDQPYMNPNLVPDEAKDELNQLYDLMYEYLYYGHQIIDRMDKMYYLYRSTSIIQDTDSALICLDGWYNYVRLLCDNVPIKIKHHEGDVMKLLDDDPIFTKPCEEMIPEYDFTNDELIEVKRAIDPMVIIPQDGLKFSIINILSYIIGKLANDYMNRFANQFNSDSNGTCMIISKNEFLMSRLLATEAKKHYSSHLVLQEGNLVPQNGKADIDVKGMEAFTKSSTAKATRDRLKKILYEDILTPQSIDQIQVLRDIAVFEKEIKDSIERGDKTFYKPVKIRSQSGYENPMRIQGIKAACAYNALHEDGTESIDLSIRNSLDVVKVDINPRNIDLIKDNHPQVYEKAIALFNNPSYAKEFGTGIDTIAIPGNEQTPDWVKPFIRYAEIINENVSKFPLESIGIYRGTSNNNTTNMISF